MQLELDLKNQKRIIKEVKITYYETFDDDGRRRINKIKEVKKWFGDDNGVKHNPTCSYHSEVL